MREHKGRSGVYLITNTVNGKVYVGKTKDFYKRYCQYVSDVRARVNGRINDYLMNAFVKHGFEAFRFSVIEELEVEKCAERELYWIGFYNATKREFGYNLRTDSSSGMIVHPDTSVKISNRLKQEWASGARDDHSMKMRENWKRRDKSVQSDRMTRNLTKYLYEVHLTDGIVKARYKELANMGLKNVVDSFHRKQTNDTVFKGVRIVRILNKHLEQS
jgi:group I intron endonuclease